MIAEEIEVKGVILSSMPIGEYDKRVMMLTDKFGKIHAFARSARKIHSKLLAGTDPLTFGSFKIFSGKNAFNISEVSIIDYFGELKSDLDKLCYGYYVLEFASYFAKENMEAKEMLRLIYVTLKALSAARDEQPPDFLRVIFEWRMFAGEGLMPDYSKGMVCGSRISDTVKYALDYILKSEVKDLFKFTLREQDMAELIRLCEIYHKLHIDKKFHSLEMIVRGD